jgi:uncharacterized membrane protein YidH (DUF202 family)
MTDWENRDATRRTRLANERTYLAWWRTGLTAVAVAFGAGKLVPEVAGGTQWPYEVIGIGFAVLGVLFIARTASGGNVVWKPRSGAASTRRSSRALRPPSRSSACCSPRPPLSY